MMATLFRGIREECLAKLKAWLVERGREVIVLGVDDATVDGGPGLLVHWMWR